MNKRRRYKAKRRRALLRGDGWTIGRYERRRTTVETLRFHPLAFATVMTQLEIDARYDILYGRGTLARVDAVALAPKAPWVLDPD